METYISRNDLWKYLKEKNILGPSDSISFTIGADNYTLDVFSITKNGTLYGFDELTTAEQDEINIQLDTHLSGFLPLNSYSIYTSKTEEGLQTILNGITSNDVQVVYDNGTHCFTVIAKS